MALPSTGTTWSGAGFSAVDNRFLERGKLQQALVRDARGSATNISPHSDASGTVNWSPFAQDGKWRDDLLAQKRVNGVWINNLTTNEGFHVIGAFKEGGGATSKPNVKKDDFMIEQSNSPFDTDLISEGEPFSLTPVETAKPVVRRLRNNLRLADDSGNNLVELPGAAGSGWGRPVDGDDVDRQWLLVREFKHEGLPFYKVAGFALAKLSDIGNSKQDKKDSEASELTYQPLPEPFFMAAIDGDYRPVLMWVWEGGSGWAAMYGSATSQWLTTLGTQSSGTFTLTFLGNPTTAIAYNATNATVKAALAALDDGYTASDWTVAGSAGGPYTITTPHGHPLTGSGASLGTPGTFVIAPV